MTGGVAAALVVGLWVIRLFKNRKMNAGLTECLIEEKYDDNFVRNDLK